MCACLCVHGCMRACMHACTRRACARAHVCVAEPWGNSFEFLAVSLWHQGFPAPVHATNCTKIRKLIFWELSEQPRMSCHLLSSTYRLYVIPCHCRQILPDSVKTKGACRTVGGLPYRCVHILRPQKTFWTWVDDESPVRLIVGIQQTWHTFSSSSFIHVLLCIFHG